MRRVDEVLEIVTVDRFRGPWRSASRSAAMRREKLSEAFNENEKRSGLAKPWPKASKGPRSGWINFGLDRVPNPTRSV